MTFRKFIVLLIGAATLGMTFQIGLVVYWWLDDPTVWLSTVSPNGKYTVELTGDKGRGGFIIYSVVNYNLLKDGIVFVSGRRAHHGDSMDISFELAYPEHAWINDNTLRFWREPNRPKDRSSDLLLVSNNTDKVIRFLRIRTKDMFFVFDIQPRSNVRLSFSRQWEGNDFWAEGEFDDGSAIEYGVSFLENGSREPLGYCMTIDYDRVTINSPREKGYDYRGSWNNLNIDTSSTCQP
jgi:hypothetical protein